MSSKLSETFSFLTSIFGLIILAVVIVAVFKGKPEPKMQYVPAKVDVGEPVAPAPQPVKAEPKPKPKGPYFGPHSMLCNKKDCYHPLHGERPGDGLRERMRRRYPDGGF